MKFFAKLTNYSTALMTFKSVNKIAPPYLTKRFVLYGNRNEKGELVGVNTRAARKISYVFKKQETNMILKRFFIMVLKSGIIYLTIYVKLNLSSLSNPKPNLISFNNQFLSFCFHSRFKFC